MAVVHVIADALTTMAGSWAEICICLEAEASPGRQPLRRRRRSLPAGALRSATRARKRLRLCGQPGWQSRYTSLPLVSHCRLLALCGRDADGYPFNHALVVVCHKTGNVRIGIPAWQQAMEEDEEEDVPPYPAAKHLAASTADGLPFSPPSLVWPSHPLHPV